MVNKRLENKRACGDRHEEEEVKVAEEGEEEAKAPIGGAESEGKEEETDESTAEEELCPSLEDWKETSVEEDLEAMVEAAEALGKEKKKEEAWKVVKEEAEKGKATKSMGDKDSLEDKEEISVTKSVKVKIELKLVSGRYYLGKKPTEIEEESSNVLEGKKKKFDWFKEVVKEEVLNPNQVKRFEKGGGHLPRLMRADPVAVSSPSEETICQNRISQSGRDHLVGTGLLSGRVHLDRTGSYCQSRPMGLC